MCPLRTKLSVTSTRARQGQARFWSVTLDTGRSHFSSPLPASGAWDQQPKSQGPFPRGSRTPRPQPPCSLSTYTGVKCHRSQVCILHCKEICVRSGFSQSKWILKCRSLYFLIQIVQRWLHSCAMYKKPLSFTLKSVNVCESMWNISSFKKTNYKVILYPW